MLTRSHRWLRALDCSRAQLNLDGNSSDEEDGQRDGRRNGAIRAWTPSAVSQDTWVSILQSGINSVGLQAVYAKAQRAPLTLSASPFVSCIFSQTIAARVPNLSRDLDHGYGSAPLETKTALLSALIDEALKSSEVRCAGGPPATGQCAKTLAHPATK